MTDKPNYNDGQWHGWNGGKCPVHPKSRVDYIWHDLNYGTVGIGYDREAIEDDGPRIAWAHVVRFRVVKEHREPRAIWVFGTHNFKTQEKAIEFRDRLERENPGRGFASWPISEFREVTK